MRIGIAGSGNIVKQCLCAITLSSGIDCTAIVVRPPRLRDGETLAQKYNIKNIYTDYEKFLCDAEVDVVYIGIVNTMHYEYAKKALLHKKNVIVEKPFTVYAAQAHELASIANENNLFLFEAITMIHSPNFLALKENLPSIGRPKIVMCNYSQYSSRYDSYLTGTVLPAFDPSCAGGALLDINIYNLHFVIGMFGVPLSVEYFPNIGFNGIDTSGIINLNYAEMQAVCVGSKDSGSPGFCMAQGEKGFLRLNGPGFSTDSSDICINNKTTHFDLHKSDHYMVEELNDFKKVIENKDFKTARSWLEHTLNVMDVLEKARNK
ncbi:NAD(P)-dependent oxidoreductase [Spirochaetia bacterium]|nr:NAD(P)-dependent oxidoreductase [Spirochaetia bacterium]